MRYYTGTSEALSHAHFPEKVLVCSPGYCLCLQVLLYFCVYALSGPLSTFFFHGVDVSVHPTLDTLLVNLVHHFLT